MCERYYRCNKCGASIARESSKPSICTSSALMPARRICGGSFTRELTKEEVVEQLKQWNYSDEEIKDFFKE